MQAQTFLDSAQACAAPLCAPGQRVGARIEAAVTATWARVGCNTNLGIVLLAAPLVAAAERLPHRASVMQWRSALATVLTDLDREDAAAAFRAIVQAQPAGLGQAPDQDVRQVPAVSLRDAMALAAERDRIARQYRDGFAELLDGGLRAAGVLSGAWRQGTETLAGTLREALVQQVFLHWLASAPDSHIVRKHGAVVAQTVMQQAQHWRQQWPGVDLSNPSDERTHAWKAWDERLKGAGINPGTSADLTVATLMLAQWLG